MSVVLRSLTLGDDPSALGACGLMLDVDGTAHVGGVQLEPIGTDRGRGLIEWGFDGLPAGVTDIDGIPTEHRDGAPRTQESHPAAVVAVDHVVVRTPDLRRTVAALEAVGLELRRERDILIDGVAGRQAFFVAGTAVLEVVGPIEAVSAESALLWGLALVVSSEADASDALGDHLGEWRDAVQPGRRIATLRHEAIGTSVPTALMTPRPT